MTGSSAVNTRSYQNGLSVKSKSHMVRGGMQGSLS